MKKEFYDVIIIGAGVIGASIARFLSRFKVKCLILEKHNDVGEEASGANSAIVHSGYDPKPNTLKATFNVIGAKMFDKINDELDVNYIKTGTLTIGFNNDDLITLKSLKERGAINGVETSIIGKDELFKLEPNLNKNVLYGLYAKEAGIVNPFLLVSGLIENALENNIDLKLNSEVINIEKIMGFYRVFTKDNCIYEAKILVNASGRNGEYLTSFIEKPKFKIIPRKGQYILFDHFDDHFINRPLFMCPTKMGKGVLVSKTTSNNYYIGPTNEASSLDDVSTSKEGFDYLKKESLKLINNLPIKEAIREFSGVRANNDIDDFIIEESNLNEGFFNVSSIMSPGLASSLAIGEYVSNLIQNKLNLKINENYNPYIRKYPKFNNYEELKDLININPLYGKFICRCEKVSEGMIIDMIHRKGGPTTVKGIKKRLRAGFGRCQGTFCQEEVIKILSRELNIPIEEVNYSDLGTNILKYRSK